MPIQEKKQEWGSKITKTLDISIKKIKKKHRLKEQNIIP